MDHGQASGGQVLCATRVGRGDHQRTIGIDTSDRGQFAIADVSSQMGMQQGVRAPSAATEAVVAHFDHVDDAFETTANGLVNTLDVTKMARILHDDLHSPRVARLRVVEIEVVEPSFEPFVDVDDT